MNILTSFFPGGFIFYLMWLALLFDCFWINENLPIAGKLINHKCRNGAQVVTQEHGESDLQFVPSFFHFQIETFALGLSFYLVHRIESGTLSKLNPSDLRWSFHIFLFKLWFCSKGPFVIVTCFLFQLISFNSLITTKYKHIFSSSDILVLAPFLPFLLGIL